MKSTGLFILLFLLASCEVEENHVRIFYFRIDGETVFLKGRAQLYTNYDVDTPFSTDYYIYNLETPQLHINTGLDSTMAAEYFDFPRVAAKYSFTDSLNRAWNYTSVEGNLEITDVSEGVLFGDFEFVLINNRVETDTIRLTDGHFEISLENLQRVW